MDARRRKLAAGRREAFAELCDTLAERLYRLPVVRLRSRADADDVLQGTFTRLARNRGRFERVENLTACVFKRALRIPAALQNRDEPGKLPKPDLSDLGLPKSETTDPFQLFDARQGLQLLVVSACEQRMCAFVAPNTK